VPLAKLCAKRPARPHRPDPASGDSIRGGFRGVSTDSSRLQESTVEIARDTYRKCRATHGGTQAEFEAACVVHMQRTGRAPQAGYAASRWVVAAMAVAGNLRPHRGRATQLGLRW